VFPFYTRIIIALNALDKNYIANKHMAKIKREIKIKSTNLDVRTKITDFKKMSAWFLGVKKVIVLSDYLGIGTQRIVTIMSGQSYRERIIEWDEKKSFSYMVVDPIIFIMEWEANISLRPMPDSVLVQWEIHYKMRYGILGKIVDAILLAPIIDKLLLFSLKKLKNLMET